MLQDKWLILRFKHGSQAAFCRIFQTYHRDLLRVAMSLLQDKSVAEDIVHEVFLRLIQARRTFELTGSLRAYLSICVANLARNANRNSRHTGSLDEKNISTLTSNIKRPDEWALCSEQFETCRIALLALPDNQREVVVLRIHGQLTFKEIAELMDCSIKTVQSRYKYAIDKLRVLMDGEISP